VALRNGRNSTDPDVRQRLNAENKGGERGHGEDDAQRVRGEPAQAKSSGEAARNYAAANAERYEDQVPEGLPIIVRAACVVRKVAKKHGANKSQGARDQRH
jgi:hypothetical protein